MAYNIQKTDNTTLITVNDTELNSDFGITLVGRNYSGYGVYLNDNFVRLMENFAKSSPPARPLNGQLWYDSVNKNLNFYNGGGFKSLAPLTVSASEPSIGARGVGDLWWDTDNLQLKAYTSAALPHVSVMAVYDTTELRIDSTSDLQIGDYVTSSGGNITLLTGSRIENITSTTNLVITNPATVTQGETVTFYRGTGWNVIGPSYSIKQGVTGTLSKSIVDTNGYTHTIGVTYVKDQPVSIFSKDQEFTPRGQDRIAGWDTIKPGLSMRPTNVTQIVRSVTAYATGSLTNTVVPISSIQDVQAGDFVISSNISLGSGVTVTDIFSANSSVLVNYPTGFGQDEIITFQRGTDISYLFVGTATNSQSLDNISSDRYARNDIDVQFAGDITTGGNLYFNSFALEESDRTGNVSYINNSYHGSMSFYGNVAGTGSNTLLMKLDAGTGRVQVAGNPTSALHVVPKQYSDAQLVQASAWLAANVATLIGPTAPASLNSFSEVSGLANSIISTASSLAAVVALKANSDSPTLTGIPTAPTAASTEVSTQIATTQFVATAVDTLKNATEANSAAQSLDIALRAPIDNPLFTGSPRSVTPPDTDQSTFIATTRFVSNLISILRTDVVGQLALKAPLDSPFLTGVPIAPTALPGTNSTQIATTEFVTRGVADLKTYADAQNSAMAAIVALKAPSASPVLTGIPRSSNPPANDNSDRIATTSFVLSNTGDLKGYADNALNLKADKASPALTGVPTAPNAIVGTNTDQISTTGFVAAGLALKASISGANFTSNITVPALAATDNSGNVASTTWVRNWVTNYASARLWQGSSKFVSTLTPDANTGSDGDFWFQYTP